MSSLYGLQRNFYAYLSDDGNTYQVALTNDDASAGSFGAAVAPGVNPVYPRGWRMRKLYGTNATYGRTKIPVASPTIALWTTPSSFDKKSQTFIAEGAIGERRTDKT